MRLLVFAPESVHELGAHLGELLLRGGEPQVLVVRHHPGGTFINGGTFIYGGFEKGYEKKKKLWKLRENGLKKV